MTTLEALIDELSILAGIAPSYADQHGRPVETPAEVRPLLLAGFGLPVTTVAEAEASLARLTALRRGPVAPLVAVEADTAAFIPLRLPASARASWHLIEEGGSTHEGFAENGRIAVPPLPAGYHRLSVKIDGATAGATVIAAPPRCFEPTVLHGPGRHWGLTAPVYGLMSERNLGIGDFTDVADLAEIAGGFGAAFLGLSPIHALFPSDRSKVSPYSPSSRLFIDPIYLDPSAVPGFDGAAAGLAATASVRAEAAALREAALIDHRAVWALKQPLLEALWQAFDRSGDPASLAAFRQAGGETLERHARFEALSEHFAAAGLAWSGEWPAAFRDAGSAEVAAFAAEHAERIAFHAWLQQVADQQFAGAAARAEAAGMEIGLYRDLAVGADRGGSEVWMAPERFCGTLSIGAPPDPLAPQGQDWGLPPLNPLTLDQDGLAAFRALVSANMRHAGAIRIDHAFQLRRLFLIPLGCDGSHGAYVDYPFDAMLAVLRVESHRAGCMVIGEDLGTAPEGFSDAIMRSGVLSYRVLSFERTDAGGFAPPESYPRDALAVITTHDLPTFAGWWKGLDIDLRLTLGIFDHPAADAARASREADRAWLAAALAAEGLLPDAAVPVEPPLEATVRYLARAPSTLASVQIEDVLGDLNQQNMPGVDALHPNWRRRLSTATVAAPDGPLARLASAFAEEGRGAPSRGPRPLAPPPTATYRVQFHKDFTFDDAAAIVPYLAELGISHLYASPIQTARPGSTHGYDIADHRAINPELGGEDGLRRLSSALKAHGLGLIVDIVPNHMGIGGADNHWWLAVLEWGELSPHSETFDIDWQRLGASGKLVVPFLGERYGDALEQGTLRLAFDAAEGSFSVWHHEHRFPVSPPSYPIVLDRAHAMLDDPADEQAAVLLAVSERLRAMAEETAGERRAGFPAEAEELRGRLAAAVAASPALLGAIERAAQLVNGTPGLPESFGPLHRILEGQPYRLAHWRVAASDINYRRFFDINSLAGIRVEKPEIFDATHELIFSLVRGQIIDGLRIDHIDGLADPAGYARALQREIGPGFYVVIEKILEPGEELRPWPVAGTTGYDILNQIDGLFVARDARAAFDRLYRTTGGGDGGYAAQLRAAKTEVVETSFASELEVLVSDVKRIADADRRTRDFTAVAIRQALSEIIARFPVYRTYMDDGPVEPADRALIEQTVAVARRRSLLPDRSVHDFIAAVLLGDIETDAPGRPEPDLVARFRRRFQQLTGPAMAKSLEDTLFYRYAPLLALNEVGGDPGHFGLSPDAFHAAMAARVEAWPNAMTATATHDTKRGEDNRARLLALSEVPDLWAKAVETWMELAAPFRSAVEGEAAPDDNDLYILLQSLLGAWPTELMTEAPSETAIEAFRERMAEFLTKALREAKRHSSWVNVNEAYETAAAGLLAGVLREKGFYASFVPLARRLALAGAVTGLARTALKCTLPGVPDIFQGTEFWDFSLVDPDNRRPVDYTARIDALEGGAPPSALMRDWQDGRVKQRVLARLLGDRAASPLLYGSGDYRPLPASGAGADHIVAFSRSYGDDHLVVVVPRLIARRLDGATLPPPPERWPEATVQLPPGTWHDVVAGREVGGGRAVGVAELFTDLPIAVLRSNA